MRDYLTADDFEGLSGDGLAEACLACSARFSPMFFGYQRKSHGELQPHQHSDHG